jgi:DNA-3-methyladenine glycosylase II
VVSGGARAAEEQLAGRDPVMATLVARHGPCTLPAGATAGGHLERLARTIVSQQLAGRAAAAIWARVRALVPGELDAAAVLALDPVDLRAAGLSGAKTRAVLALAGRVAGGTLDLDSVAELDDEAVVGALSAVPGIGRWTAQMFLIFQLGRPDVWPVTDLGVRRGYARAWRLDAVLSPVALEAEGERFRPWRSVVAWYCWRVVDAQPPESQVESLPTGR